MEFVPLIKEGISLIESTKEKKTGTYYVSELSGGCCIRKVYYSYFEKPHESLADAYELR